MKARLILVIALTVGAANPGAVAHPIASSAMALRTCGSAVLIDVGTGTVDCPSIRTSCGGAHSTEAVGDRFAAPSPESRQFCRRREKLRSRIEE